MTATSHDVSRRVPSASPDAPRATIRERVRAAVVVPVLPQRLARRILTSLLRRVARGTLTVSEGGRTQDYGDDDGPHGHLEVLDPQAWRLVAQRASTGLGEAYLEGMLESEDLVSCLRVLTRNLDRLHTTSNRLVPWRRRLAAPLERGQRRAASDDRANVVAHYDVGDDFFELFLDPTMAYSCAVFGPEADTLEAASIAKFELVCEKLVLTAESRLVEIGSGWGGFAVHAAATRGCQVTTTTISERQFTATQRRVEAAGLAGSIEVRDADYRDLDGRYTHLASIEMIEAVGWRDYDAYFAAIERLLEPGGRAVLQCILIGDADFERAKRHDDFIRHYIFPGGCLPSVSAINASLERVSTLRVVDHEDLGSQYVRTLREWRERLDARWEDARALGYEERFLRLWRFYLCYCEAAFAEGHVTAAQLVLERPATAAH